jgi:GDP-L-fucose synthase
MVVKRILVTGSNGLVGSALQRRVDVNWHTNSPYEFIFVNRKYGDLTNPRNVSNMYHYTQPDIVIHLAAKVGGVNGNMSGPVDFFEENVLMDTYMMQYAYIYGVEKFIGMSSVCVFPDGLPIMSEKDMHLGEPHPSNFAYAYAKRMLDIQMRAYRKQYGVKNYCTVIPTNIYGPNDNYNLENGHVIPSLIHKIYLATKNNTDLVIWGDGKSEREFIHTDDVADVLLKMVVDTSELPERLLLSNPHSYSINDIVAYLVSISDFPGKVVYDTTKPSGQKKRPSDISLLRQKYSINYTGLYQGLTDSYKWFVNNYPNVRL